MFTSTTMLFLLISSCAFYHHVNAQTCPSILAKRTICLVSEELDETESISISCGAPFGKLVINNIYFYFIYIHILYYII